MASGGKGNAPEAADLWYAPARPGGEKAATAAAVGAARDKSKR